MTERARDRTSARSLSRPADREAGQFFQRPAPVVVGEHLQREPGLLGVVEGQVQRGLEGAGAHDDLARPAEITFALLQPCLLYTSLDQKW